jgi:hypothetical protein
MVVNNPTGIDTNGPSVFGLYRNFTNVWGLPADTSQWRNYVFSYSFRETNRLACSVEMQVKSSANNWIEYKTDYTPGPDGWQTVRASLDQFVRPGGIGLFDPNNVQGISLNIRMLRTNVTYVGYFDNAFFDAPDLIMQTGNSFGLYQSTNVSVPDNTTFAIQSIQRLADGAVRLSWQARTNLSYTVEYQDGELLSEEYFLVLAPLTNLTVSVNSLLPTNDLTATSSPVRFYRVRSQPR